MRPARAATFILVILAMSMLCILPTGASDSAVAIGDVEPITYSNHLQINADSEGSFDVVVRNYLSNTPDNSRMVSLVYIPGPGIELKADDVKNENFVLDGEDHLSITVRVKVDKYAAANNYEIGVYLKVKSLNGDSAEVSTAPVLLDLVVLSPLSSGNAYNKILGYFDNPLPEPFNTPAATAVITFLLWMVICVFAMIVMAPLIFRLVARNHEEEGKKLRKGLRVLVPLVVVLFAIDSSLRVFGAGEAIVGMVESWFNIFYILLGALISWKIYLSFVQYTISKISKNKRIDQKDVDIEPLLRLLGKLVISVVTVMMVTSVLGFDITAVIMSAGIVSLGITLGAQNVLNQFFSGMVLLITRPFKSGDLVKIGTAATIYRVLSVNIMNTVFENWDSEETVIMPNNAVSSSIIVNMTGDGLIYKVTVFMNISYANDIDIAKDLMVSVAKGHPNVIVNGSVDLPSARVASFQDSSIELRLRCYVYDFNDSGRIGGELREGIYKSFKNNGISVPFPQMDVHLHQTGRSSKGQ